MARRKFRRPAHDMRLNLFPIMNLFVCLIPFLLMSAVFVHLGGLRVEAPSPTSEELEKKTKSQPVTLTFKVVGNQVTIAGYTQDFQVKLKNIRGTFSVKNIDSLRTYLEALKKKHRKIGSSLFFASPETKYDSAIKVLNALEASNVSDNVVLAAGVVE